MSDSLGHAELRFSFIPLTGSEEKYWHIVYIDRHTFLDLFRTKLREYGNYEGHEPHVPDPRSVAVLQALEEKALRGWKAAFRKRYKRDPEILYEFEISHEGLTLVRDTRPILPERPVTAHGSPLGPPYPTGPIWRESVARRIKPPR